MMEFNPEWSMNMCIKCHAHLNSFETQDEIIQILYGLGKRHYIVLVMIGLCKKTLEDCGKFFGVTRERIRQIYVKGQGRALRRAKAKGLGISWDDIVKAMETNKDKLIGVIKFDSFSVAKDFVLPDVSSIVKNPPVHVEKKEGLDLDGPIEDLDLSVRTHNCLMNAGFETVRQVLDSYPDDVRKIKNMGRRSLNELDQAFEVLNIRTNFKYPV